MKVCNDCGCEYEPYGQRALKCRPCRRIYDRQYHANRSPATKQRKISLQQQRIRTSKQFIWDYLQANPCTQCGESDPVVLEFDHIDRSTKVMPVSEFYHHSLEKIKEEIAKCRVLCANCHRRHTAIQMGWYKDII